MKRLQMKNLTHNRTSKNDSAPTTSSRPAATPRPTTSPLRPHATPTKPGLPQSKATTMARVEPSGSKYIQTLTCLKKILQPYDFDGLSFD